MPIILGILISIYALHIDSGYLLLLGILVLVTTD